MNMDRSERSDKYGAVDLRDALRDLDEARKEAREEGFPAPSEAALRNARRLLRAMYDIFPQRFEVYPTPDGEIAIDAPGGRSCSFAIPMAARCAWSTRTARIAGRDTPARMGFRTAS